MSGIFKGDSIYKSGGGGGGYKDGGALVDGEYIKVENNTVSSYDNTTRNDVNFYFDVADGEVINSVVELTTSINATIHVYILKNGLFIPLGNVGGDTVNAGDDYNLSVVGNSFMLEVVTPSQAEPAAIEFDGNIYPLVNVNGLLWSAKNLKLFAGEYQISGGNYYYRIRSSTNLNNAIQNKNSSCRLPTYSEIIDLINYFGGYNTTCSASLCSASGWQSSAGDGNNSSGLNFLPESQFYSDESFDSYDVGRLCYCLGINGWLVLRGANFSPSTGDNMNNTEFYPARFVVDIN